MLQLSQLLNRCTKEQKFNIFISFKWKPNRIFLKNVTKFEIIEKIKKMNDKLNCDDFETNNIKSAGDCLQVSISCTKRCYIPKREFNYEIKVPY